MAKGRIETEIAIAARICAGLGTVLNWGGKKFSPVDFMPRKVEPMQLDKAKAFELIERVYLGR